MSFLKQKRVQLQEPRDSVYINQAYSGSSDTDNEPQSDTGTSRDHFSDADISYTSNYSRDSFSDSDSFRSSVTLSDVDFDFDEPDAVDVDADVFRRSSFTENFNGDEDTEDRKEPVQLRQRTEETKPNYDWDVFSEGRQEKKQTDNWYGQNIYIILKLVFSAILFLTGTGCAVLSKTTLMLVVANINPPGPGQNNTLKTLNFDLKYPSQGTYIMWIWALFIIIVTPYVMSLLSNIWRLLKTGLGDKKSKKKSIIRSKSKAAVDPKKRQSTTDGTLDNGKPDIPDKKDKSSWRWKYLFLLLSLEMSSCIGLNILLFTILPTLEPISGVLITLNVATLPAIIGIFFKDNNVSNSWKRIMNIIGFVSSIAATIMWIYHILQNTSPSRERTAHIILMIISLILTSAGWWKTQFNTRKQKTKLVGKGKGPVEEGPFKESPIHGLPKFIRGNSPTIEVICNTFNIIITFLYVIFVFDFQCGDGVYCTKVLFKIIINGASTALTSGTYVFWRTNLTTAVMPAGCSDALPIYFALVNVFSAFVCYRCCSTACKILVKIPSYTIPMVLATPLTVLSLVLYITQYKQTSNSDVCLFPFPISSGNVYADWRVIVAGLAGYISMLAVTYHIWSPGKHRMLASRKIFSRTIYTGPLLDQSLLLNKMVEEPVKVSKEKEIRPKKSRDELYILTEDKDDDKRKRDPDTTVIYMCATMWHEEVNEMIQILLSILRMDRDQWKRMLEKSFNIDDKDYYEFEAHIFFDDAFTDTPSGRVINHYVKKLLECVPKAVSLLYGSQTIEDPKVMKTPYGGRIQWSLPGRNVLIAHLKDPKKIRKKKRWSQVMYMYYFFAHKLRQEFAGAKDMVKAAKNRYILALDGDVDFKPSSVQLLVDRMKKNPLVGAACGRIHPIGTGPMVWYQKFEYAVSHWLQKAAEHVTGCVLCSPGCFSLFRASSLMDNNVMKRYTATPSEAHHHIQYDQGEDRWLCTLLLQQGYRVEYCAASDALTYAPESFKDFYNQRRRWTPSTMANIIDLLLDWRHVIKHNRDISRLYIAYQVLLMVSSILTPGTIFLMIIGAISMAYPSLSLYWSLILNGIPLTGFIVINISSNNDNLKVTLAAILSVVYALVMMLVVVGLLRQVFEYGICSVTTMFLCGVAGVFVISAFLHPQEFLCLFHGFLYFLAIPSMSMLLMLYALCNLDNVSWGTRESVKVKPGQGPLETEDKKQTGGVFQGLMQKISALRKEGKSDYAFSFGNLCRCFCCPRTNFDSSEVKFEALLSRFDALEAAIGTNKSEEDSERNTESSNEDQESESPPATPRRFSKVPNPFSGESSFKENPLFRMDTRIQDYYKDKEWMNDEKLMNSKEVVMSFEEEKFWIELIQRYLKPYQMNDEKKSKDKQELTNLRNKVCLFFILMNALFITIVFCLQQVNIESGGTVSIPLPCSTGKSGESVEPISIAFTLVFGILLAIQFFCMLSHRISTFLHICSMTTLTRKKEQDVIGQLQGPIDDDTMSRMSATTQGSSNDQRRLARRRDRYLTQTLKGDNRKTRSDSLTKQFIKTLRKMNENTIHNLEIDDVAKKNLIVGRKKTLKKWQSVTRRVIAKNNIAAGTSGIDTQGNVGFAAMAKLAVAKDKQEKAEQGKDDSGKTQINDQTENTTVNDKM